MVRTAYHVGSFAVVRDNAESVRRGCVRAADLVFRRDERIEGVVYAISK
jgi:hypothetical protein